MPASGPSRWLIAGALMVGVFLGSSGCATVVRGTTDNVRIETNPPGANVHLSTGDTGVTPVSFNLPRKHPITVELEKAGFEKVTMTLNPTRSKQGSIATAGNAFIGGAVGSAIDSSTGAALDLQPNP